MTAPTPGPIDWSGAAAEVLRVGGYASTVLVGLTGYRKALQAAGLPVPVELAALEAALRVDRSGQQVGRVTVRGDGGAVRTMLTYPTAAGTLGMSPRTLRRRVADGTVPACRIGRRVLFDPLDLARVLTERTVR